MKRNLCIALSVLTLLTGCGSPADVPSATDGSSATPPTTTTAATTLTAEEYETEIAFLFVEVSGKDYAELPQSTLNLIMYDGKITDIQSDYIIAEGIMADDYHETTAPVIVKYYLDEDGYPMSGVVMSEDEIVFTPLIPYSMDFWYETAKPIVIYPPEGDEIILTKDTFPTIELVDDWTSNYQYKGTYVLIDSDGNKWMPRTTETYNWGYREIEYSDGKYEWQFPEYINIVPYEE